MIRQGSMVGWGTLSRVLPVAKNLRQRYDGGWNLRHRYDRGKRHLSLMILGHMT